MGSRITHALEIVVGAVLLLAAVVLWRLRSDRASAGHQRLRRESPLVGATIALAEFPTAVPYFVIIVAVIRAHAGVAATVALLAAYVAAILFVVALILLAVDTSAIAAP